VDITEEIKKLATEVDSKIKNVVETSSKETTEKTAKLIEEIEKKRAVLEKMIEEQQKHLDTLSTDIKKHGLHGGNDRAKSFDEQLKEAFEAKKDDFPLLKAGHFKGLNFEMKAAGNMLINTNYTGQIGLTTWDNEISRPARREPFIRQLVTNRRITSMYVAYAELKNRDGGADTVAEGAPKPQTDFDIVEASKKVEKIAHFIKTSKEALDDIPALRGEINSELIDGVNLKLDEQILKGNGVSPNLTGIITYITAALVPAAPFAVGVILPNTFDVLVVAAATVVANGFRPNYAVMHPDDVAMMGLAKTPQGAYILPPFSSADGMVINGLRIVANAGMTKGDFLVGDFSKDILAIREEVNIQVGYVNDDFTRNLVTILAELRAVNYIKSNYLGAFVKGTIATVLTAITKP
jgi:HK97 family phage major capsid protein